MLLARALLADAELLVLDEPTANLDLVARERFRAALAAVLERRVDLTTVTVMHAFEEFPRRTSHLLLLREGRVVAAGPVADTCREEPVSACYGMPLAAGIVDGRMLVSARGA